MTEDEAKKSPCIGPRPELTGVAIPGERPGTVVMWACRGSDCKMAWRTLSFRTERRTLGSIVGSTKPWGEVTADEMAAWAEKARAEGYEEEVFGSTLHGVRLLWLKYDPTPHGYCGLVAKP